MIKRAWELKPGDEVTKRGNPVYVEMTTRKGNDIEIDFSDGTFRLIERYAEFKVLNFEADVRREVDL
jgi:hypothetical protein